MKDSLAEFPRAHQRDFFALFAGPKKSSVRVFLFGQIQAFGGFAFIRFMRGRSPD